MLAVNKPTGSWAVAAAMREQEQRALLHRPQHELAFSDARYQLRRCLSALRSVELPQAADAAALGAVVDALADQLTAIEQLAARL